MLPNAANTPSKVLTEVVNPSVYARYSDPPAQANLFRHYVCFKKNSIIKPTNKNTINTWTHEIPEQAKSSWVVQHLDAQCETKLLDRLGIC